MDPDIYDHLRSTDADDDDAVYRVVGSGRETVTLLRVTDADGRRANTGEVIAVPADALDTFERVDNPDGNRPLGAKIVSGATAAYWSLHSVVTTLAANPGKSLVALAAFVVGRFGGGVVPLSEAVLAVVAFAGLLGLAAIGSGRL